MRNHIQDRTLIDWLEDELDPSASRWLERHLAECADCRARMEALREEESLIREALAWTAEERETLVSPRGQTPVWQAVARKLTFRERGHQTSSRRTRAVAGIAGIAIAATFLLLFVQAGDRLPALDVFRKVPTVVVESVGAKPGETVYLSVRVENIEGPCGLVAKLRFDPHTLKVLPSPSSAVTFAKVDGEEITIAALSKDGWKGQEGIVARIPVVLQSTATVQEEFNLDLDSVQLVGEQRKPLETKIRGGRIRVL
jgi:hypothetical protein